MHSTEGIGGGSKVFTESDIELVCGNKYGVESERRSGRQRSGFPIWRRYRSNVSGECGGIACGTVIWTSFAPYVGAVVCFLSETKLVRSCSVITVI